MMSMMHSIELRSPFLDYRIAQLGLSMPSHLKIHGNETKKILRDLASKWLPNDIATGRKKGFGIPLNHFLTKDNKSLSKPSFIRLSIKSLLTLVEVFFLYLHPSFIIFFIPHISDFRR